jgi:hypothetical protein
MPVVFRQGGLRYYFFSNEGQPPEPIHIHIKGGRDARFGWNPRYRSPTATALTRASFRIILLVVAQNRDLILRAWNDHLGD